MGEKTPLLPQFRRRLAVSESALRIVVMHDSVTKSEAALLNLNAV